MIEFVAQWFRRWRAKPAQWMEAAGANVAQDVELQRRLAKLAIGFDGRQYTYADYRYDRLDDAVRYAELMLQRQAQSA